MPLLNKQPFSKSKPPPDLRPDEEVFFCEPTKEVFRDYDKFFERMILCNSLLWSCEMTGKSGLTYQEAADSERDARRSLSAVSKELKRAILYICTLTKKTNFGELYGDIFAYVKDRYFRGEAVLAKRGSQWVDCVIQSVVIAADPELSCSINGHTSQAGGPAEKRPSSRLPSEGISAPRALYHVLQPATGRLFAVRHTDLRRDKALFSRERLRVLLKHSTRADDSGFLVVRAPAARGLDLDKVQFGDLFVGAPPRFAANKPVQKQKPATETRPQQESKPVRPKTEMVFDENDDEPLSSVQLEIRQRWEAERRRLVELKVQERDRKRHRRKLVTEWLKDWTRPREDLLCEDHQELPVMQPVHTRVPAQLFGGCLQLLEFVSGFSPLLDLSDTFPLGVTLSVVERALCDGEVAGALSDLLQVLLRAVFELQREEDEESGGHSAAGSAAAAADHLDPLTLTEVLRRHLAARDVADESRWRYQQRGGYTESDNPTVQFRLDHPDIMQKLNTESVYDLTPGERLAVLECLVGEILTTVTARDMIDDAEAKLKELKQQLRVLRINTQAFQRGVHAEKVTERREDRQRQQQQEQQRAAADTSADPATDGDTSADPAPGAAVPEPLTEEERARRRRDQERQLVEFGKKETRLQEQIAELSRQFSLTPLGRDRAYRRYWAGRALPGLYVEHDDDTVGVCLPNATPHNRQLSAAGGDQQAVLRRLLTDRLMSRAGEQPTASSAASTTTTGSPSDKENTPAPVPPPKTYTKKPATLTEQNQPSGGAEAGAAPADLEAKTRLDELVSGELDLAAELRAVPAADSQPPDRRLLVCTGQQDECPVHSAILPRTSWSFCPDLEHLEQLLSTLNERGVREAELKAAIQQAGDSLRRGIEKCPKNELIPGADRRPRREPTSSGRDPNYNFPTGTPVAEIQELLLRDMILECEEKIRFGCLGTVQVSDLAQWRQALVERSYDQQCDKLTWGAEGAGSVDNSVDVSGTSTPLSDREAAPVAAELATRLQRRHLVRSLASAVLQLEQGIDKKYLQSPLGASEKARRVWESSLMASTSLSQLFVHFAQLESSVQWSRSALNARCKLCRKRSDPEKMLLCDGCDKGFHMFCLTPKMKSIPKGDWYCSSCRPKEKPKSPKKKRRAFVAEDPESEDEEQEDEEEPEEAAEEEEAEEEPPQASSKRSSRGGTKRSSGGSTKKAAPASRRTREASPPAPAKKRRAGSDAHAADRLDKAVLNGLLDELRKQPAAEYFLKPVRGKDAPGYYQIVRQPMDLTTMQKKINSGAYGSAAEFTADAGLIFSNCLMYNDTNAPISRDCLKLRRFFEKRSKELGLSGGPAGKRARRSH
ncbi:bromodomain adjacent to zinc finger domain protein 1A-like [Amphibalanus amphitrite]|uniref:bromodomain adjacent to zinc finger domain protein 1A-like n=1 Tax=Amphibalanus amphitrite TaxID=1232801 RepID=UPI001C8FAA73|nr:bromodomain adjacent to zinc finger domain protein 1A-like [Amphibalanus amphitrite]XP_043204989.1 bromodomain adjacent to zinc finger domain protein 1A-like [Amphibalanus amphitrite]XP_043204990.1 bromodomain adjacent to zinc finger domain protein 1A-like [Amphibalanus amphitrite]